MAHRNYPIHSYNLSPTSINKSDAVPKPEAFWSTMEVVGESTDLRQQDSSQKESEIVRSDSEWAFEKFIRETTNGSSSSAILEEGGGEEESDVVEMMAEDYNARKKSRRIVVEGDSHSLSPSYPPGKSCAPDPEFLKKQLDLACAAAAAAFCRTNVQEPSPSAEVTTITRSEMASQSLVNGSASGVQKMLNNDQHGNGSRKPALSKAQNSVGQPQIKPLPCSSSREQTDEDELLSGAETVENLDPADAKRVRRMISNRESARRSRRRKQAHLSELETQVSQLKGENSSLIEKLSDLHKKYHEACVNNRILKADVETMGAKVKMAEDMVKRVTGVAARESPRWVGSISKLWNNAMNESVEEVPRKCVEVGSPPISSNGMDAQNWNHVKSK